MLSRALASFDIQKVRPILLLVYCCLRDTDLGSPETLVEDELRGQIPPSRHSQILKDQTGFISVTITNYHLHSVMLSFFVFLLLAFSSLGTAFARIKLKSVDWVAPQHGSYGVLVKVQGSSRDIQQ